MHATPASEPYIHPITVYSKPNCPNCTLTCRLLEREGIPYRVIDVSRDADALAHVKGLGYCAAPVVQVDADEHWSGFRPDRITALLDILEAA
jgi:glutaredoxin-like protein NrdH